MTRVGEALVVHTRGPATRHALSPSATLVWLLCDGRHTPQEMGQKLAAVFPEAAARIHADVDRTLQGLRASHLIRLDRPGDSERPLLRVAFSNFPPDYEVALSYFSWLLTHLYDVLLVDPAEGNPDIVFYSTFPPAGYDQRDVDRSRTKKVLVTDEAGPPDFSECDFAFTTQRVAAAHAGQHRRLPAGCVRIDWPGARASESDAYLELPACHSLRRALFEPAEAADATGHVAGSPAAPTKLTIGMATFDDYDGVYFTVRAIRLYHPSVTPDTEIVIVDNNPEGVCSSALQNLEHWVERCRYVPNRDIEGTAVRNIVFEEARSEYVLCVDSHVLLAPGAIQALLDYFEADPDCRDLLQGPLVMDDLTTVSTHFDPVWRDGMYGIWATDPRGVDPSQAPFEIPMQGLGLFACRRDTWLGFNPRFSGFGGEEGYIHEKFRRAGHRTLCLPFLRWMHRFNRPFGTRYPIKWEERVRNYFIGFRELGLDTSAMEAHFADRLGAEAVEQARHALDREDANPFDFFEAIVCINLDTETGRWEAMRDRFSRLGILDRVQRFSAVATPGNHHVGCALSHRAVIENAKTHQWGNVLVIEDDAIFLETTVQHLRDNLGELERLDWDVFHLGGCKWGNAYEKAPGCEHVERISTMTCTQAVAYHHTVYDTILADLPPDEAPMRAWVERHAAIDQYLNSVEKRFVTSPVLATQPNLLPQEDPAHRDGFVG